MAALPETNGPDCPCCIPGPTPIGEYFADLIVADTLIVELKACRTLVAEHVAQMLGYLRSAKKEHGLLMNFGGYRFQIRKYAMRHESLEA
jgi:GxxExxY protein